MYNSSALHEPVLGTALVETTHGNPWCNKLRALTDTGIQTNLITKEAIKRLNIQTKSTHFKLLGPQNTSIGTSNDFAIVEFKIPKCTRTLKFQFLVVKEISHALPNQKIDLIRDNPELSVLKRVDPNYNIPGRIDALFGIGIWIKIIKNGLIKSNDETAAAQNTVLGWVLYSCNDDTNNLTPKRTFHTTVESPSTENILERFWQVEDLSLS